MSSTTPAKQELENLKSEADALNIQYSPRIGIDALQERIDAAKADEAGVELDKVEDEVETKKVEVDLTPEEKEAKRKKDIITKRDEANRLIRVIVTPNEPEKRGLNGEIFSMSNDIVSQKKYVAFNNESGWHIPMGIYNMLKEKKFQTFRDVEVNGRETKRGSLIPAYNITVLDSLTPKELKKLGEQQAARNSIKKDD